MHHVEEHLRGLMEAEWVIPLEAEKFNQKRNPCFQQRGEQRGRGKQVSFLVSLD